MTILTVTLNAAIDKRYDVDEIGIGRVQRVDRVFFSAGGKGLNVARGACGCGQRVIATGFLAGFAGRFVASRLAGEGIEEQFLEVAGETRTCINIIDRHGNSTEFLEPGAPVTAKDLQALQERFDRLLAEVDVVTISGSAPAGCPENVYSPLIAAARAEGLPVILDTSGDLLRSGVAAGPTIVKPNREELGALVGRELPGLFDVVAAARSLIAYGPSSVVISLGAEGAIAVERDRAVLARPPRVPAVNPVGCGDVLVGGLATGLAEGLDLAAALPRAVGVATAAAAHPETGRFDPELAHEVTRQIQVSEL